MSRGAGVSGFTGRRAVRSSLRVRGWGTGGLVARRGR